METRTEREGMDAGQTMSNVGEQMKGTAAEMKERAQRAAERAGEVWETTRQNLQEKTMASARATDRAIRENPYASLGVAFGLGLLIGVLVNRGR